MDTFLRTEKKSNIQMSRLHRILTDQDISGGKPIIKGTRISVALILEILASGGSFEEILTSYTHLTREDILACLAYVDLSYKHGSRFLNRLTLLI